MTRRVINHFKKIIIAVAGTLTLLAGLIMLAYPGPGVLVVFAGFAILATEFKFAQGVLEKLRKKYDTWKLWFDNQHVSLRITAVIISGALVLVTAWLLNTFGVINRILNLHLDWLVSPLPFFG